MVRKKGKDLVGEAEKGDTNRLITGETAENGAHGVCTHTLLTQ